MSSHKGRDLRASPALSLSLSTTTAASSGRGRCQDALGEAGGSQQLSHSQHAQQQQRGGLLRAWRKARPFVNGWVAGSTALLTVQPADVFKMRYQMGSKLGFVALGKKIVGEEGVRGLYKGLDAGLARQLTYGMARLGVFKTLTEKAKNRKARRLQVRPQHAFTTLSVPLTCFSARDVHFPMVGK